MREKNDMRFFFDFARASAIAGIYFFHFYDFGLGGFGSVAKRFQAGILQGLFAGASGFSDYLWGLLQILFSFGNKGVEIFIIASGFGLYLSHLEKGTSWREFYRRRVIRVLPLYWAACVSIYLMFPVTLKHLLMNVFLVQIFTPEYLAFGPLWFISYLFLLYIMFPLFVLVFRHAWLRWALFAASFFMTPVYVYIVRLAGYEPVGVMPTAYISVFLLGMLIAGSFHRGGKFHRTLLSPAASALAFLLLGVSVYLVSYGVPFTELMHRAFGILSFLALYLPCLLVRRIGPARKLAGWVAYAAYVIYLVHAPLFIKMLDWAESSPWPRKLLVYPVAEFPHAPVKFMASSLAVLVAVLVVSMAVQKAYDRLVAAFAGADREKPA